MAVFSPQHILAGKDYHPVLQMQKLRLKNWSKVKEILHCKAQIQSLVGLILKSIFVPIEWGPWLRKLGTGVWGTQSRAERTRKERVLRQKEHLSRPAPGQPQALDHIGLGQRTRADVMVPDTKAAWRLVLSGALLCALSHFFLTAILQNRRKECC